MPFAPPRAQMQRSQVQLLSTMVDELAFAGAPRLALAPLTALHSELSKRDPSFFNDAMNFKESTTEALDVQREARGSPFSGPPALPSRLPMPLSSQVFLLLADEASWEEDDAEEAAAGAQRLAPKKLHVEVIDAQKRTPR